MKKLLAIVLSCVLTLSCGNTKNDNSTKAKSQEAPVQKTIKLMPHVLTLQNATEVEDNIFGKTDFKVIVYIEMNCHPCWESSLEWKRKYRFLKAQYPEVPVLVVLHGQPNQFKEMNKEAQFDFPVFLDTQERFRNVNHIGYLAEEMTFVVDSANKVLLTGRPFTEEMIQKYDNILSNKNAKVSR